jgi:hypothetical protein
MKRHPFVIFLFILGVAGLIALVYLTVTAGPTDHAAIESLAAQALKDAQTAASDSATATKTLSGDGFSLQIPEGWQAKELGQEFIPGQKMLFTLRNGPKSKMFDGPETVTIDVLYQSKNAGFAYDQTVSDFTTDQAEVQAWVDAWAGAVTLDDFTIAQEPLDLEGVTGAKSYLECRKGCFPDERFATNFVEMVYILDVADRVYVMKAKTYVSPQSDQLIDEAEAVMASFQVD